MRIVDRLRHWARRVKRDGLTLWFALRDPRTPWLAKALGCIAVAYALSPIDLIPDFIPVLGLLDELLLLPVLIGLAIRLLPADLLAECRSQAERRLAEGAAMPRSRVGALIIVLAWTTALTALAWWLVG